MMKGDKIFLQEVAHVSFKNGASNEKVWHSYSVG